jgi:hypothetical protein
MRAIIRAAGIVFVPMAVLLILGGVESPVSAQFETPNRAFHNATAFRLEGKHATVACASCHLNGQFAGTPTSCYQCHWVRRQDDRFKTRLGTQCEQCHRPTSWTAVRWDHASLTGTPLNASHRTIECESCHKGGEFRSGSVACISCHQKDYAATTAPNHAAAGFPTNCDGCHRPSDNSWHGGSAASGAGFDHNAVFPLTGVHAMATCTACHKNGVYKGTTRECVGCHQADYNRTQNPNHAAAGFSTACEMCHRASDPSFKGASAGGAGFNHNAVFPLVGVHATQACGVCHKNNVYKGTSRDCVGCHLNDYNRTTNPNHAASNFSTACDTCHRPTDTQWGGGTGFNHNSVFALVGVHATQACATCHVNNVFKGTPRDCVGCHLPQYNATRSPSHVAANFPTTCDSCHRATDTRWQGATFNHNSVFALVGVHATQACTACHVNNVYRGTSRECVGCHLPQYNATRSPSHIAAGFPTTCATCHQATDTSWTQGRFSHTAFPLNGPHNRPCMDCHTTANNFTVFSCTVCHARGDTDSHHRSVTGYRYDSAACYACHPNGRH